MQGPPPPLCAVPTVPTRTETRATPRRAPRSTRAATARPERPPTRTVQRHPAPPRLTAATPHPDRAAATGAHPARPARLPTRTVDTPRRRPLDRDTSHHPPREPEWQPPAPRQEAGTAPSTNRTPLRPRELRARKGARSLASKRASLVPTSAPSTIARSVTPHHHGRSAHGRAQWFPGTVAQGRARLHVAHAAAAPPLGAQSAVPTRPDRVGCAQPPAAPSHGGGAGGAPRRRSPLRSRVSQSRRPSGCHCAGQARCPHGSARRPA